MCKHHINREDMKNISVAVTEWGDGWTGRGIYGAIVTHEGVCSKCSHYVRVTERLESRALHELEERKPKTGPEKPARQGEEKR